MITFRLLMQGDGLSRTSSNADGQWVWPKLHLRKMHYIKNGYGFGAATGSGVGVKFPYYQSLRGFPVSLLFAIEARDGLGGGQGQR